VWAGPAVNRVPAPIAYLEPVCWRRPAPTFKRITKSTVTRRIVVHFLPQTALVTQGKFRQNPAYSRRVLTECAGVCAMADDPEQEKGGEVRFGVSSQLWKYLGWLARTTLLGRNENEVARQVLTEKLAEMRQEDYRDGQKP
jgi:hypothetical protein